MTAPGGSSGSKRWMAGVAVLALAVAVGVYLLLGAITGDGDASSSGAPGNGAVVALEDDGDVVIRDADGEELHSLDGADWTRVEPTARPGVGLGATDDEWVWFDAATGDTEDTGIDEGWRPITGDEDHIVLVDPAGGGLAYVALADGSAEEVDLDDSFISNFVLLTASGDAFAYTDFGSDEPAVRIVPFDDPGDDVRIDGILADVHPDDPDTFLVVTDDGDDRVAEIVSTDDDSATEVLVIRDGDEAQAPPRFTPDGDVVAVIDDELLRASADGDDVETVVELDLGDQRFATFVAGGRFLVIDVDDDDDPDRLVNVDDGSEQDIPGSFLLPAGDCLVSSIVPISFDGDVALLDAGTGEELARAAGIHTAGGAGSCSALVDQGDDGFVLLTRDGEIDLPDGTRRVSPDLTRYISSDIGDSDATSQILAIDGDDEIAEFDGVVLAWLAG